MSGDKHYEDSKSALNVCFRSYSLSAREVALAINIPHDTLQKYILGVSCCPVEVFRKIYIYAVDHKKDAEASILRNVLIPKNYKLVTTNPESVVTLDTVDAEVVEDMDVIGSLIRLFKSAVADDVITYNEYVDLIRAGEKVIAAVKRTILKIKQVYKNQNKPVELVKGR